PTPQTSPLSLHDALPILASVRCSPVSLKISHESTVPNSARPSRARSRRPSTCSSSHSILVAEKYGSSTSPVRARDGRALFGTVRSEEHTSELQSRGHLVC